MIIVQIVITLLFPLLALQLERRNKMLKWLGAVIICYLMGFLMSYSPAHFIAQNVSMKISEIAVLLAIPMLLFATDFRKWLKNAKVTLLSFGLGVFTVFLMAIITNWIFSTSLQNSDKIASLFVGAYTGGMPNLASLYLSLEVAKESYLQVVAVDTLVGSSYFLFLITIGAKLLQKKFPKYQGGAKFSSTNTVVILQWSHGVFGLLLSVILLGISIAISQFLHGELLQITVVLTLSSLAICASFSEKIRSWKASFVLGDYSILVFCVAIGSATKFEAITGNIKILYFCLVIMFGAIIMHAVFCYVLGIDGDTFLITSIACIFGPAFIAPIARVLNNDELMIPGITTGVVGLALGNYFGLTIYYLLQLF